MRPARQVIKRAPHRTVGLVVAPWLQPEAIEHESFLEKGFVEMAVVCPAVAGVQHQPFEIEYQLGAKRHRHVPDFLVRLVGGQSLVVEIKPARFVPEHRAKFDAVSELLRVRGQSYWVLTEDHMPTRQVQQAGLWRRYARTVVDGLAERAVLARLASAGVVSWPQLLGPDIQVGVIFHLLGQRRIESVDGLQVTESTGLQLPQGVESGHECFYFERWFACQAWRAIAPP